MIRQIELTIASKASERSFIISLTSSFIYIPPSLQLYYNIVGLLCQYKKCELYRFNRTFYMSICYKISILDIDFDLKF